MFESNHLPYADFRRLRVVLVAAGWHSVAHEPPLAAQQFSVRKPTSAFIAAKSTL